MQSARQKVFRIERNSSDSSGEPASLTDYNAQQRHEEIMAALHSISARLGSQENGSTEENVSQKFIETCQRDLIEARKIKDELQLIHDAIDRTKQEIATLHRGEYQGVEIARMTNELGAIVEGTEQATETILHAAEQIDADATNLIAALRQSQNKDSASDIQEQVVKIFEACNFQDLTGQRISKVVKAFGFIEERVDRMMEIWGGLESFKDVDLDPSCTRDENAALLNGPALEEDEDVASQDDIDALFD